MQAKSEIQNTDFAHQVKAMGIQRLSEVAAIL